MRPTVPEWKEDELRDFCRAVLRAFPGAVITVRNLQGEERGQPNKRPQP